MGEWDRRFDEVMDEVRELRELVDGQESWSHRRRLHVIETKLESERLVAEAIDELRRSRAERLKERATLWLMAAALVVSIIHPHPFG